MSAVAAEENVTCATCRACCCKLEVMLLGGDDEVPEALTRQDPWGGWIMHRLEDGWCMASGNDGQQVGGFSNHFVSMCLRALRLAELNLPPSMVDDESCSLSLTALNAAAACCCCSRLL